MKKKNVVITDRFSNEALLWLERQPQLEIQQAPHPKTLPIDLLVNAHALLIRSRTHITEDLLKRARQLQVIVTATSGFDHIDLDACTKWGIAVMHTPTANIESTSQLTMGLVISLANRVAESRHLIESGHWAREHVIGLELCHRNYGIVGLGRIGRRVAKLAQSFGMNVFAYDPYLPDYIFESLNVQKMSYEDLLKHVDVVSFHVPKTVETEKMLHRDLLSRLPRPLIVVNTSRGSVIEMDDLIEALQKGWLRGVGLDVFEQEPLKTDSELLKFSNVLLTPHIGANTEDAFAKASQLAAQKLVAFFLDGSTSDSLPPRVPWYGATPLKAD